MIRPNVRGTWEQVTGRDLHGDPELGSPARIEAVIVEWDLGSDYTTVRADSSASRGYAREVVGAVIIYVKPSVAIARGDRVTLRGETLRVVSNKTQMNGMGCASHFVYGLEPWEAG